MSFDFFNLSNLAFGSKLTMAFTQLERLVKEAVEHIDLLVRDLRIYAKYLNRNYEVSAPEKAGDAVRSDELYSLISEKVIVNDITYIAGELYIDCVVFNPDTGRITKVSGYSTLASGYCYFDYAISNIDTGKPAKFFTDQDKSHGVELFKFTANKSAKTCKIDWSLK